jgi:hypothetical protein
MPALVSSDSDNTSVGMRCDEQVSPAGSGGRDEQSTSAMSQTASMLSPASAFVLRATAMKSGCADPMLPVTATMDSTADDNDCDVDDHDMQFADRKRNDTIQTANANLQGMVRSRRCEASIP